MNDLIAVIFVSEPAETGDTTGYTLKFDALTMELVEVIDDQPYCLVSSGTRLNTKYIPNFEDLQIDLVITQDGTTN